VATPSDNWTEKLSSNLSLPTGEGIIVDIGTGDGRFVYQSAQENPKKFYIGIDASPRPLAKISEKIHRRPEKGGLANILFIQAAVENLPSELDGIADEVHVHFPWGSLLKAVATGDPQALGGLRRICSPDALLEVVIGLDAERDNAEMRRLGIELPTTELLRAELALRYFSAGFEIVEKGAFYPSNWPKLRCTWAKRLRGSNKRSLVYMIAIARAHSRPG